MKNLKPQTLTRLATIALMAAGVLTGALLSSGLPHAAQETRMAIDPAIPALVVVGKRLTPTDTATVATGLGPARATAERALPPHDAAGRVARVAGL